MLPHTSHGVPFALLSERQATFARGLAEDDAASGGLMFGSAERGNEVDVGGSSVRLFVIETVFELF